MIRKIAFLTCLSFLIVSCAGSNLSTEKVALELKETFSKTEIVRVSESEIPGVYEVYYRGIYPGIFYYYPPRKIVIFGEFWSVNGTSITGERLMSFVEKILNEKK